MIQKTASPFFEGVSLRFVPCRPQGVCDITPSRHYDSRALSGALIVPLPRKRFAVSAAGGASPFSTPRKVFFTTRTPQGGFSCRFAAIHLLSRQKTNLNLFRAVHGRLGSRWRLCRLTDAAYPLRVKTLRGFSDLKRRPANGRTPQLIKKPRRVSRPQT